jgi:hypothetical protein
VRSCGLPCPETAAAVSLPRVEVFFGLQVLFEGGRHRVGLHSGLATRPQRRKHTLSKGYMQTIILKDGEQFSEVVIVFL